MEQDELMQSIDEIHLASDHAGFELKESIHDWLLSEGYNVVDHGAFEHNEHDDYPDFIGLAASAVSIEKEKNIRAIIFGGSGQGEAILANRFPGVRAVVFNGQYESKDGREIPEEIITARQHNNANVLSIGSRFLNREEALEAIEQFLDTSFSEDPKYQRRIEKTEEVSQFFSNQNKYE